MWVWVRNCQGSWMEGDVSSLLPTTFMEGFLGIRITHRPISYMLQNYKQHSLIAEPNIFQSSDEDYEEFHCCCCCGCFSSSSSTPFSSSSSIHSRPFNTYPSDQCETIHGCIWRKLWSLCVKPPWCLLKWKGHTLFQFTRPIWAIVDK